MSQKTVTMALLFYAGCHFSLALLVPFLIGICRVPFLMQGAISHWHCHFSLALPFLIVIKSIFWP